MKLKLFHLKVLNNINNDYYHDILFIINITNIHTNYMSILININII